MMQTKNSLQYRLMMSLLGVTAFAWLLVLALTWYETDHELNELLDAHLAQTASFLVAQTGDGHEAHHDFTTAPTLHKYQPRVAFQIWHEGEILVRSEQAPQKALRTDSLPGFANIKINGQAWRVFSTKGKANDIWIHVAELGQFRQDILNASLKSALVPLLIIFPFLTIFIWWSIRIALQPLRNLGEEIGTRKASSLTPLSDQTVVTEVQPLVKALNLLFQRVEVQMNNERQFTSDAAHELRTPIAAIRMQAQVAIGSINPEPQKIALEALIQACDRANRLISQLLELSRLDAVASTDEVNSWKSVDAIKVTRDQLANSASEWLAKNQQLSLEAPEFLALNVNPDWLAIIVRNLVDNASRYSPSGAIIRIKWQNSKTPCLVVEDSGPGISEEDMRRMGDRFFRVLGNDSDGCGLGWSIVQKIAKTCHVQIELSRSEDLGGLKVQLTWPTA